MARPRAARLRRESKSLVLLLPPLTRTRAWHAIKFLDPRESGAVIPILHANGFKISERTIFGCMDDKEIVTLFSGYGYQVQIVKDMDNIDDQLQTALEWSVAEIKKIQQAARSGNPISKPRWPMLVLRTPKVSL
jgi:xylulose-5-phosphate/fructose-6-phosphate phosphoketolase